jgi:hypothetical protein
MNDRTLAGHDVAFLVLYPTGAVSQSFLPGLESEIKARQHAQQFNGLVVALPVVADFRTGPEPSAYADELVVRTLNVAGNINAHPEPPAGSVVRITSGKRVGRTHERTDVESVLGARSWFCTADSTWRTWMQVQQDIGDASWGAHDADA